MVFLKIPLITTKMKDFAADLLTSTVQPLEEGVVSAEMRGMRVLENMKLLEENMRMASSQGHINPDRILMSLYLSLPIIRATSHSNFVRVTTHQTILVRNVLINLVDFYSLFLEEEPDMR
jgi:hypothetical protein